MSESSAMQFSEVAAMVQAWITALPGDKKVVLFTGNLSVNSDLSYDTVISAMPTGSSFIDQYGANYGQAAAFLQPFRNDEGNVRAQLQSVAFNYSGSDVDDPITGYALISDSEERVIAARRLPEEKQMSDSYDTLVVNLGIDFPNIQSS